MGLERIASMYMQGVLSNFEIDIFTPITKNIAELIGNRP